MTKKKAPISLTPVDYLDRAGRKRRALVPAGDGAHPEEGIPLSLDLDDLYPDAPEAFLTRLHNELWQRGLIEPQDFLQPGAPETFKRALLAVIRLDFMTIKQLAQEGVKPHDG